MADKAADPAPAPQAESSEAPRAAPQETPAAEAPAPAIVVDEGNQNYEDDNDSALSVPVTDSLASLRSSVLEHQIENGRTYHSMSSGKYNYPNDAAELDRLDLQHNLWLLTLRGQLCLSPGDRGANRVLDIGTGTGIWAIEYADAHPGSEVIGVDLSPVQPSMVPPNCTFEIDDLEKEWTWTKPFDFIFGRVMVGSFVDPETVFKQAFDALEPGGYMEMQEIDLPFESDDGTLEGTVVEQFSNVFVEASKKLGRPIDVAKKYRDWMEKAGFVDIVEKKFRWPINQWPRDKHYKDVGMWYLANLDTGMEGLTMALATRGLGWTPEETMVFCTKVRKALRDTRIHAYLPCLVIYGRKPGPEKKAGASES